MYSFLNGMPAHTKVATPGISLGFPSWFLLILTGWREALQKISVVPREHKKMVLHITTQSPVH